MKKILIPIMIIAIIASFSMAAFAEASPTASTVAYNVTVSVNNANLGKVNSVTNQDGTKTFTANSADGSTFTKWVLPEGFEIVSGSLTSATITVRVKSGVSAGELKVEAVFADNSDDAQETTTADNSGNNDSDTSPQTGSAPVAGVAVVMFTALGAAFVAKKKLSK